MLLAPSDTLIQPHGGTARSPSVSPPSSEFPSRPAPSHQLHPIVEFFWVWEVPEGQRGREQAPALSPLQGLGHNGTKACLCAEWGHTFPRTPMISSTRGLACRWWTPRSWAWVVGLRCFL